MEFAVLGPLEVTAGGVQLEIRGAKERALLAHLVASCGRMVPIHDLMLTLWGEEPPRSGAKSLQRFVLRLRNALEPDRSAAPQLLVTAGPGYRLDADPMSVDAERFARLARLGREALARGRPDTGVQALEKALRLWRGPAYAGFQDTVFGEAESRRLDELRLSATEDLWAAEIERDRAVAAIPELERLLGAHPLRERLWQLLMLALYRDGQQGAALTAYDRAREVLADELGIDPGPALRELHGRLLTQDPSLTPQPRHPLPARLSRHGNPLVGREEQLDRLLRAWERARRGERVGIIVRGPAGSGRSHLASALASEVVRAGAPVSLVDGAAHDVPVQVTPGSLLVIDHAEPIPTHPGAMILLIADEGAAPPGAVVVWPGGEVSVGTGPDEASPASMLFDPLGPAAEFRSLPGLVLAVSPDGRRLLVSEGREDGGILHVYDSSGAARGPRSEYDGFIDASSFSPDGSQVVVAFEDHVEVRDAGSLAVRHTFTAHNGAVLGAVSAGPAHDFVWTAGRDGTATALDLTGRRGLFRTAPVPVAPHTGQSATGTGIAVITTSYADRPNPAQVIDLATGRDLLGELEVPPASCLCQVEGTAMTSDGSLAVGRIREFDQADFSEAGGGLMVWDTADGSVLQRVTLP